MPYFDGINLSFELFRGFLVFVEFVLPEFGVRDPAFRFVVGGPLVASFTELPVFSLSSLVLCIALFVVLF
jgi:hypothetical protein